MFLRGDIVKSEILFKEMLALEEERKLYFERAEKLTKRINSIYAKYEEVVNNEKRCRCEKCVGEIKA